MTDSKLIDIKKKVYTKPILTEVRLVAQEAVLSLCKNNTAFSACIPDPGCSLAARS
jgi:hypothetical protein